MDNYTASPLAGSFMRTVGKILVSMRQWLWVLGAETGRNLQPKCKAMPTPVGVWWAFAKKAFFEDKKSEFLTIQQQICINLFGIIKLEYGTVTRLMHAGLYNLVMISSFGDRRDHSCGRPVAPDHAHRTPTGVGICLIQKVSIHFSADNQLFG
jgi:hypothetical protein